MKQKKAFIFIILAGLLWGSSCLFVSALKPYGFTSLQMTGMRGILAGIGMTVYALLSNRSCFRVKPQWLLVFACNGICSILQKEHQTLYPESYSREFMLFAMLLCSIVFSVAAWKRSSLRELGTVSGKRYGVLSGLANGIANFLTLVLAGMENASVLFPILSAGTILASLLCGRVIFREKLKANHYVALVLGIAAVVLLKL